MRVDDSPISAVRLADRQRVPELVDPICELYDLTFAAPPFIWPVDESDRHRAMMDRLISEPTFGLSLAETGSAVTGFAYGYQLGPTTGWWEGFQQPVPTEFTREWPGRTFAVIDLAVHPGHRRQGLGRRLLNTLLDSRTEERATLAIQPQSTASHDFYRAIGGWRLVGRQSTPGFVSPEFDIYVWERPNP